MSSPPYPSQEQQLIRLFSEATDSVVSVTTFSAEGRGGGLSVDEMDAVPFGTGSGFVYGNGDKCYILTSYHVICNSSGAKVLLNNHGSFNAFLKGYDGNTDIAVLEINALDADMVPVKMGNSSSLAVGQSAYAIGNPFGLDHSLTSGIVSGVGRDMKSPTGRVISNCIQTDCSTSPGSSGGPLLNSSGEVIGMNTSIYTPNGRSAGIFFAVPADTITLVADSLIADSRIIRPVLNVRYVENSQALWLGIDVGVLVLSVVPGSDAAIAGIVGTSRSGNLHSARVGDVILAIDGVGLGCEADLFKILESHKVGDSVCLSVSNPRQGKRAVTVKLEASSEY